MKSLLEQLTQHQIDLLNKAELEYPYSVRDLKKVLSEKHCWINLTITEANSLIGHLNMNNANLINSLVEIFGYHL